MKETTSFQTTGLKQNTKAHSLLKIGLIVANVLFYIVVVFINATASSPAIGIFNQETGNISDRHPVDITPAGWTFSTWGIIYTWQGLWIVFSVVTIFLKTDYGRLYLEPPVFTFLFFVFIFLNYTFNIGWLFIWDNEYFSAGFAVLALLTIALYIAAIISHKNIYEAEVYLDKKRIFLWLYRILLNNGLAFYATWVTLATFLNMSIAWTYEWNGKREVASAICLAFAASIIFTYFVLEIFILEKFLRYTFSPYLQLFIAFSGILAKNWSGQSPSAIFGLVLIIIIVLLFLVKIVSTIFRHKQSIRNRSF